MDQREKPRTGRKKIPVGEKYFSLLQNVQAGSRAHQASNSTGTEFHPVREVKHSPPSSAEVKNEKSYTSTFPIRLHGVDRENFYLYRLKILTYSS
jgi:hypothetical protein